MDKRGWKIPLHICGHTGDAYKPHGTAEYRQKEKLIIESKSCNSCRIKAADDLPPLTGSQAQIYYAVAIRKAAKLKLPKKDWEIEKNELSARVWIQKFRHLISKF